MAMKTETAETPAALSALRLRMLVLALGETASPPWWRTNLLSDAGRKFCERLFPRTALAAAVNGGGKAACTAHDEAIGRRGVFHLFRLPEAVERDIRQSLLEPGDALASVLEVRDEMLSHLKAMGTGAKNVAPGPRKIGSVSDLMKADAYGRMADVYWSGFKADAKAFPYAEASE